MARLFACARPPSPSPSFSHSLALASSPQAEKLHGAAVRHSFYVADGPRATPEVAADTIPCLAKDGGKGFRLDSARLGRQYSDEYMVELIRKVGFASVALPANAEVSYKVSFLVQYLDWVFGDCRLSYRQIWERHVRPLARVSRDLGVPLSVYSAPTSSASSPLAQARTMSLDTFLAHARTVAKFMQVTTPPRATLVCRRGWTSNER